LYVIGHGRELTRKTVEFLQQQDFTGVILTREPMPGTFTLDQARINTADAPDIVVSFRWFDENSKTGTPGTLVSSSGGREPGQGNHASLSRFEMHNTLIAAGPDFGRGLVERSPSGNPDLAPTILSILGVKPLRPMDGRVLTEAAPAGRQRMLETRNGAWRQYLKITECGNAFYIDEGNGSSQVVHSGEKRVSP
jgi:hypothetical protein